MKRFLRDAPWGLIVRISAPALAAVIGLASGIIIGHLITPPSAALPSQPSVLVRAVCSDKGETRSRLEHIVKLQKGFETQASAQQSQQGQKGVEEFAYSMAILTITTRKYIGGSVAVYLENGYFLAITHGVTEAGRGLESVNHYVRYFYRTSGSENWSVLGTPLYDVTALVRKDLALLYTNSFQEWGRQFTIPYLPTGAEFRFRSSTTLEVGEPVYMVTFNPKVHGNNNKPEYYSVRLVKGEITSFSGPTLFSNQFQTSIPVEHGQSGSALFDKDGNLVGSLSAISKDGANRSSFASIDGLAELLDLERNRLEGCLN